MDAEDAAAGDMGVAFGGFDGNVAEEGLDVADIGAAFHEVCGKGVAQAMNGKLLGDSGLQDRLPEDILGGTDREVAGRILSREKPGLYIIQGVILGDNWAARPGSRVYRSLRPFPARTNTALRARSMCSF